MIKEVLSLIKEIKRTIKEHKEDNSLVSNCFFLKNGNILALRNPYGDSRYPYSIDGLTMWIYASGNISNKFGAIRNADINIISVNIQL
jgi:hypothetical protein